MFSSVNKCIEFIIHYFSNKRIHLLILSIFTLMPSLQATQLPSSSLESLTQVAQQCRQKVDELWKLQKRLPQAQRRDFHIAIGNASKNCNDLRDLLSRFNQANVLKQAYEQSLNEAQNLTQPLRETP